MYKEEITSLLIQALGMLQIESKVNPALELIQNPALGDWASAVPMKLAPLLHENPMEIGEKIRHEILMHSGSDFLESITIAKPGFINFRIKDDYLTEAVLKQCEDIASVAISFGEQERKKIIVEHTSTNPNKALHVGHLRNFTLGDGIVRLFRKLGYPVEVHFYNDNTGVQLVTLVLGILEYGDEFDEKIASGMKYDHACGDIYVKISRDLEADERLREKLKILLASIEEGTSQEAVLAQEITYNVLKAAFRTLGTFGIYYNTIVNESEILALWPPVFNELIAKKLIVKEMDGDHAGCYVLKNLKDLDNPQVPLADKILVRSDGTLVYTAKDILYHLWEYGLIDFELFFEPFLKQRDNQDVYISVKNDNAIPQSKLKIGHAEKVISVVDSRQAYPMRVVRFSLDALGFKEAAKNKKHLSYAPVLISGEILQSLGFKADSAKKGYMMSGRKGIDVKVDDLLRLMSERIDEVKRNNEKEIDGDELLSSLQIAAGAVKYYMLKFSNTNEITIDYDDVLKHEGNTGPYLQYAYARAQGVLRKGGSFKVHYTAEALTDQERLLVRKMGVISDILLSCSDKLDLSMLATYTFELCSLFASFYQQVNIVHSDNFHFRMTLVSSFGSELAFLLDIFGIEYSGGM